MYVLLIYANVAESMKIVRISERIKYLCWYLILPEIHRIKYLHVFVNLIYYEYKQSIFYMLVPTGMMTSFLNDWLKTVVCIKHVTSRF